jgi:lysophospholipase L1-like esterase
MKTIRTTSIYLPAAAIFFAAAWAGLAADTRGTSGDGDAQWVGTWGAALHEPDLGVPGLANAGFNNQTLREIVHVSVGGQQVRVRLSTFGANRLLVGAAHVGLRSSGASIDPATDRMLTFGGRPSIAIPPGASVLSDPADLRVPDLSDLAVSIFVPENTGPATWHFEARQMSYVSTPGDFTGSTVLPTVASPLAWFWLAGVDVLASERAGAVVALGDSITDGTQSTADANNRWPDQLAKRLIALQDNQAWGVLNEGIAGGRILYDSLGPNALARFDRDVLAQTGVAHVIVQLGGNDIFTINPAEAVTAEQVIQAHRLIIERAHAKGLRIYGCTLTPVEGFLVPGTPFGVFTPTNEAKRQTVNAWIRTSGLYDGVIDFDRVLRDPNSPSRISAQYDSGDHGHPTDAYTVPLEDTGVVH